LTEGAKGRLEAFVATTVFWALFLFLLTGLYHMYGKPLATAWRTVF